MKNIKMWKATSVTPIKKKLAIFLLQIIFRLLDDIRTVNKNIREGIQQQSFESWMKQVDSCEQKAAEDSNDDVKIVESSESTVEAKNIVTKEVTDDITVVTVESKTKPERMLKVGGRKISYLKQKSKIYPAIYRKNGPKIGRNNGKNETKIEAKTSKNDNLWLISCSMVNLIEGTMLLT